MSRLARNPINIPEDIKVSMNDNEINFEGKLGKSSTVLPAGIKVDHKIIFYISLEKIKHFLELYMQMLKMKLLVIQKDLKKD